MITLAVSGGVPRSRSAISRTLRPVAALPSLTSMTTEPGRGPDTFTEPARGAQVGMARGRDARARRPAREGRRPGHLVVAGSGPWWDTTVTVPSASR